MAKSLTDKILAIWCVSNERGEDTVVIGAQKRDIKLDLRVWGNF